MTPEWLFTLAAEFAQATGNADRFHALSSTATDDNARAAHAATAARWTELASSRREELRAALREALHGTVRAVPDDELPVATWQRGRVEVRATTTDGTRTVRVRYTPAQALAAGAALIACAAITDQRASGTLADILAPFPPNPDTEPTDAPADTPADEATGDDSKASDATGEIPAARGGEAGHA